MTMTTATLTHVALVPAKRHSSRCAEKNWREFAGSKNLIDLTLESIPSDRFAQVILSTDHGQYVPTSPCVRHRRPAEMSTVNADVQDLIRVIIEEYDLQDEYLWLLNPTSPFRRPDDFDSIVELIERTDCPSVVSVARIGPYVWKGDEPAFLTRSRRTNTQDMPDKWFAENGMFYVFRAADFLEHGSWYMPGMRKYVQEGIRSTVDIDTEQDFDDARRIWTAMGDTATTPNGETLRNETLEIERLIPEPRAAHLRLLAGHFHRYQTAREALRLAANNRVIDASCGQGYGSFLLAQSGASVTGLDISERYLDIASRNFQADNLRFMTYEDFFTLSDRQIDKLVCIETYEHLSTRELPAFLDRLLRCVKPGGDAFFSCPLGGDGPSEVNPHHLNEPSLGELHKRLSPRFGACAYRIERRQDSFDRTLDYCLATYTDYRGEASL